jgi:hypothetical protein
MERKKSAKTGIPGIVPSFFPIKGVPVQIHPERHNASR